MEGVGARLGRSSTRYGPAAVFTGPVRKWKKTWVPLSSSSPSSNPPPSNTNNTNNTSHLLLYKWTPLSHSNNTNNNNNNNNGNAAKDDASAPSEEPPRRKFRYVPVSIIEEQNKEASEQDDDETNPSDDVARDPSPVTSKKTDIDAKPDVNDVPAEETQVSGKDQTERQLNETNLDLSLGLKGHDGDHSADKIEASHLERVSSGGDVEMKPVANSESENRNKRKVIAPDLEMRV